MTTYNLIDQIKNNPKLNKWKDMFDSAIEELERIEEILNRDYDVRNLLPKSKDIFRPFELTSPKDVEVIMIGQDPYPSEICTGLPFEIRTDNLTPSLFNLFKEIDNEFDCDIKKYKRENNIILGDLSGWTKHVLMLNSSLTIVKGDKIGNFKLWMPFLARVTQYIENNINENCVYILLGRHANNLVDKLKLSGNVLSSSHCSGQSANTPMRDAPAFIGSGIFMEANRLLIKTGKEPINWCS